MHRQRACIVNSVLFRSIWAAGLLCASAGAQVSFVDRAGELGLDHFTLSGPEVSALSGEYGAIIHRNLGHGAAVGDYDNDGDLDVYVLGSLGQANALFRNELDTGTPGFTDVTAQSGFGLDDAGLGRVAHFVDLNNNGWLDLLVINDFDGVAPHSRVFENLTDGTFVDKTPVSGLVQIGFSKGGASLADYDHDGWLDLYVSNWGYELGTGSAGWAGLNQFFRNTGGFAFTDETLSAGFGIVARDSFTSIFTDFDDDGFCDLYVALDHTEDEFFHGGAGGFSSIGAQAGVLHTGNDMGVACADVDDDGDLDLYVTNITDTDPPCHFGTSQGNVFYLNQLQETGQLTFNDAAVERGVFDTHWGWGTQFIDVENDGDLDIVAATGFDEFILTVRGTCPLVGTPNVLLVNDGSASFDRVDIPDFDLGDDSRALIAFDYDRDGDSDILVTNVGGPVRLYENQTASPGGWLAVRVRQHDLNTFGIGVRVDATIGGVTKRRDILAGRSYLSGTPPEVHFGLADAAHVDVLRVYWTDGSVTTRTDVPANAMLDIEQPACPCERDDVPGIDAVDLLTYLAAWFASSPIADVNADNTTDVTDLLLELACWFNGSGGGCG